jgi:outer membrane protein TolC
MKRFSALFALALLGVPLFAQNAGGPTALALSSLPSMVLDHDAGAAISAQNALFAYHVYQGSLAQALPQVDFSTNYSLGYKPSIENLYETFNPDLPFPRSFIIANETTNDLGNHQLTAKLSLNQILPTGGSLFLALENIMTMATFSSQTIGAATTAAAAQISQRPVVSLGLTQPLFFNGKLLDMDLFPATLRKAQLGYLEQDLANLAQRNQTVGQAVQEYLSIVQLRKSVSQTQKSITVTKGNLDTLQKNYDLGAVAEADLLDAKIELERQREGLLELSSSLTKTERLLAHSIGRDSLEGLALADDIPALPFTLGRQEVIDKALAGHPLLQQKGLAAEEKRLDKILGGQQFASSLNLSFAYSPRYAYDPNNNPYTSSSFASSFGDLFANGAGQDYSLSIGLTVHLFDGGRQSQTWRGNTALGNAAEQSASAERQAILDQVELDLLSKASLEQKVSLLKGAADLAQRRLATEQSLLALGRSTDVNVAQKAVEADARANELWRAQADLYLTVIDLNLLAGESLQKIIEGNKQ